MACADDQRLYIQGIRNCPIDLPPGLKPRCVSHNRWYHKWRHLNMNTLTDTDEGRARPSVWPVYVAAVVVLIVDLQNLFFPGVMLTQAALGLIGVAAAIGMLLLREWGWWCGILFAGVWIVLLGMPLLWMIFDVLLTTRSHGPVPTPLASIMVFLAVCLVPVSLLLWVLATRRRLFFPPKQEGEE